MLFVAFSSNVLALEGAGGDAAGITGGVPAGQSMFQHILPFSLMAEAAGEATLHAVLEEFIFAVEMPGAEPDGDPESPAATVALT